MHIDKNGTGHVDYSGKITREIPIIKPIETAVCINADCDAFNGACPSNCENDPTQCLRLERQWPEVDPDGIDPHDPGAKLDAGKPMAGLLQDFGLALTEVSKVSTFGAKKYSRGGWQHVKDGPNRYTDAMIRHWLAEPREQVDQDSGLLHAAQVAWNSLARLELILRESGL